LLELQAEFKKTWKKKSEKHARIVDKSRKDKTFAQLIRDVGTNYDVELAKISKENREYVAIIKKKFENIVGDETLQAMKEDRKRNRKYTGSATYRDGSSEVSTTTYKKNEEGKTIKTTVKVRTKEGETILTEKIVVLVSSRDKTNDVVPLPIATTFPAMCTTRFGLDQSGQAIIDSVYNGYREQYEEKYSEFTEAANKVNGDKDLSYGERLKKIEEISLASEVAVSVLDTALFDDLVALTGLEREHSDVMVLEHYRLRERTQVPEVIFGRRSDPSSSVDLVDLFLLSEQSEDVREELSEEANEIIYSVLKEYHSQVEMQHQSLADARRALKHVQTAMSLDRKNYTLLRTKWADAISVARAASDAMKRANHQVLDDILNQIAEDDYWFVHRAFVKKAHPEVLQDKKEATSLIESAFEITSLNASQKSSLANLSASYKDGYWNICEELIKNSKETSDHEDEVSEADLESLRLNNRGKALRFERSELNDKVRMQLRMILTEGQVVHVSGLRPSAASSLRLD